MYRGATKIIQAKGKRWATNTVQILLGQHLFVNKTKSSEYYVHVYRQINVGIDKQNKTHIYTTVS